MDDGRERSAANPRKENLTGHAGTTLTDAANLQTAASWATPRREDGESSGMRWSRGTADTLTAQSSLAASWVTPSTRDWKDTPGMATEREDGRSRLDQLPRQAQLAGWATPVSTELGNTLENYQAMKANMASGPRKAITHPSLQAQLAEPSGQPPTGSPAGTEKPGQ